MAKQTGPLKVSGLYEDFCFYKMDGEYYVRSKSSLDGKRVKKDPAFARTMEYAGYLGKASKIASKIYRTMPKEERKYMLFKNLTGQAMRMLRAGRTEEETEKSLLQRVTDPMPVPGNKGTEKKDSFAEAVFRKIFNDVRGEAEVKLERKFVGIDNCEAGPLNNGWSSCSRGSNNITKQKAGGSTDSMRLDFNASASFFLPFRYRVRKVRLFK